MKSSSMKVTGAILLGGAVAVAGACGSSEPGDGDGDAFLSIVGQQNVYLEHGAQVELEVRYHDSSDVPLQGVIEYEIDGDTGGAQMASTSATTNNDGIASVTLEATNESQAQFFVNASAPDAGSVTWNVTLEEPRAPLDPNGTYHIESRLNFISGLEEGTAKDVVDDIIAFVREPAEFIVDFLLEQCQFGDFSCEDHIPDFGREVLVAALEAAINEYAPDLVNEFLEHGQNLSDLLEDFGLTSTLTVTGNGDTRDAEHVLTGVVLDYGEHTFSATFDQLNVDNIESSSLELTLPEFGNSISIEEHSMPFTYGAMLRIALERAVIPQIDDDANDIEQFLSNLIDCESLAEGLLGEDANDTLVAGLTGLCNAAVGFAADEVGDLIDGLDGGGLELVISGEAEAVSPGGSDSADVLRNGRWSGTIEYPTEVMATLEPLDNTFEGNRTD